ncbi:MAG TPA: DNA methyltransferase [Gemmatimonadaceae bacterium]|nr:DNA methyltransferase [Gemmatimonadaceae bacterium]
MRTLRQAAALLARAHTHDGLLALASALGFDGAAIPLDAATRANLGIPPSAGDVRLMRGSGALRALLVLAPPGAPLRVTLAELASSLARRTSHVLWTLIAASSDGDEAGIACWSGEQRPPRLAALLVRPLQVVASDAETVCSLEAASAGDDLLVHTRWCELLGRAALSRRFYRVLEQRIAALASSLPRMPEPDRAELALLCASRLLFLSFLQAKGWLDGDRSFLGNRFDACMATGGGFHARVLEPLFFGTLNTPRSRRAAAARAFGDVPFLNGGLFGRTPLERRHARARFSDEALGELFAQLLGAYRFTAREEQSLWSEVAIDPEMLGRAFESLMAARERRVSGAFYTPHALVAQVADHALVAALATDALDAACVERALRGDPVADEANRLLHERLRSLTVLDPACGSGAFLVHLLERLTQLHVAAGDTRGVPAIRREVLTRAIHGVDINPTAVWLCELRLWLSVVIESDETRMSAVPPLPNLDCNVRVGDTLAGDAFDEPVALVGPPAVLARLRERYVRASGARKVTLRRALAREESRRALAAIDFELLRISAQRREWVLARRSPDLFGERDRDATQSSQARRELRDRAAGLRRERRRIADGGALPFSFPSHFAHVHGTGGFGLVIGNPPWVRLHNIAPAAREALRARYRVFCDAAWEPASDGARGHGFAAQVDLAALFVERSIALAAAGGAIALLLPAKLWRSLSGGGVRRLIAARTHLERLEDWTDAPCAFDAAVYPSVLVATRLPARVRPAPRSIVDDALATDYAVRRRTLNLGWRAAARTTLLDPDDPASPWLVLPNEVRAAFDELRARGQSIATGPFGRALLGVKCGCNEAFLVNDTGGDRVLAAVECQGRRGTLERALLRPLLRGESVQAWRVPPSSRAIVWTHADTGTPLGTLPPAAARWLAPWRRRLRARSDLRGTGSWWMLFRTESADCTRTRVVWNDFGRAPRAAILPAGDPTVPLNSCYVLPCADPVDALALAALLNSPLAAAFLNAIAEPARGGWHRYLAWTVELLPVPRDWPRARRILAPLAERALLGQPPTESALLDAACRAYRLRHEDLAPLVAWCR